MRRIQLLAPTHARGRAAAGAIMDALGEGHAVHVITDPDSLLGCFEPEVWMLDTCDLVRRGRAIREARFRRGTVRLVYEARLLRGEMP